jgi:carbamate kinase
VSAKELDGYRKEGHFGKGSMAPKVDAALNFLAGGGRRAVIAHLEQAAAALAGTAGTQVTSTS